MITTLSLCCAVLFYVTKDIQQCNAAGLDVNDSDNTYNCVDDYHHNDNSDHDSWYEDENRPKRMHLIRTGFFMEEFEEEGTDDIKFMLRILITILDVWYKTRVYHLASV